ncbi:hypothetical protein C8R46DRAFT_1042147 [Mycena filopes]|nr:hypothetical protein C8R46DRAFT_1042147 [Mycena filopes]
MQTVPTAGIESSEVYLSVVPQQRHGSPRFEEPHSARGYQVQLSRDQVRGVVRRILALKADGMPCLWRESSLSRHPDHNGIVSAFMMGYVVGEISELTWRKYTGVAARYLEVGAPLHPTGTSASEAFKYMAGVYRLQTRQFKSFFASGYTRLDEFHGEVMRVGTPEDSRFPGRSLLGRMVLIYLNIWPHEHRLELQAFGFIREKEFWRKTQSESTPFLANAAFAISEVYYRGVLSLGAEFSLYAANAARFRIKSAETTGRRRARIHRSNDMLEYTPDMTGEKFKIQHLGALVAGVHSRGKFWSTDLLEWNRGPGHLKRAFKIRQKFTNLVFLPFAWMEVRNAHTVLDPTLAWLSRRVSSELLDGVFYRVACDAGVPICRTRCDAGEFLDANEFPSPDRQTQANKVDISHSGEFHQKRTGGQISQRELYIRERESKLSFGVQRGFYDPSGVHLDTTLPRPNLARNQTRISMNIDESAGASGRRACLVWSPSLKHRKLWSLTSPRGRRRGLDEYCRSVRAQSRTFILFSPVNRDLSGRFILGSCAHRLRVTACTPRPSRDPFRVCNGSFSARGGLRRVGLLAHESVGPPFLFTLDLGRKNSAIVFTVDAVTSSFCLIHRHPRDQVPSIPIPFVIEDKIRNSISPVCCRATPELPNLNS